MNTPRTAAAVLALALFNAGAARADDPPVPTPRPDQPADSAPTNNYNEGTTADGRTIVAPGTYGPFQGATCEAGSSGCTASSANDLAATTNSLLAVGDLQKKDAQTPPAVDPAKYADVKKTEDQMVASGAYKDLQRTADGAGAVITLPNGMLTYSDYVKGVDTMPKMPADVLKDPNASAAMKTAAQKMLDSQDPDKQQVADADKKMFGALDIGGSKKKSPPPIEASATTDTTGAGDQPDANPAEMGAWMANNGGLPGGALSGPSSGSGGANGGAGGSDGRSGYAADKSEGSDTTGESVQAAVGSGKISLDGVDVIQMRNNFQASPAVHALESSVQAAKGGSASADDGINGDATQGSKLFSSRGK